MLQDFTIQPLGKVSRLALKLDLPTFREVCKYLLHLPYRRPFGKTHTAVLTEGCGTCSSKHGVLKAIANEHYRENIDLVLCLFEMTALNTPELAHVLKQGPLTFIPEAHTYIQWGDEKIDVTKPGLHISNLQSVVIEERIISLSELAQKSVIHREWLQQWLTIDQPNITLEAAWQQREACIAALADY